MLSLAIGGIILLHSVIPHEHSEKRSDVLEIQSLECSTTLFDGVKFTFGLDHGDGHLEQFVKVVINSPKLTLSGIKELIFVENNLNLKPFAKIIYIDLNLPPDPLRGPPSLLV